MNMRTDGRFLDVLDGGWIRHGYGVIEDMLHAIGGIDLVHDGRVGRKDVEVVLATETFLDDLHVQ